jgi:hypothetical protein
VLVLRSDGTLPLELLDGLRDQLDRAAEVWPGLCEAYVYRVGPGTLANPRELMIRVSAGATVVPLLFHTDDLPAERVFATVRGVLAATV